MNVGLVALRFFRGSGPVLTQETFFVIFQGERTFCPPSGSAHAKPGFLATRPECPRGMSFDHWADFWSAGLAFDV